MSEEINAVINNLCERLGTTATTLIPELARLRIAESVVMIVFGLLLLAFGVWLFPRAWKYDHREDKDWIDDSMYAIIPILIIVVSVITLSTWSFNLAGWLASPTAKAVLEILDKLT